jgi:hypothetical protein
VVPLNARIVPVGVRRASIVIVLTVKTSASTSSSTSSGRTSWNGRPRRGATPGVAQREREFPRDHDAGPGAIAARRPRARRADVLIVRA